MPCWTHSTARVGGAVWGAGQGAVQGRLTGPARAQPAPGSCAGEQRRRRAAVAACPARAGAPRRVPRATCRPVCGCGARHRGADAGCAAGCGGPVAGAPHLRQHAQDAQVGAGAVVLCVWWWVWWWWVVVVVVVMVMCGGRGKHGLPAACGVCVQQAAGPCRRPRLPLTRGAVRGCVCARVRVCGCRVPKTPTMFKYMRALAQREPESTGRLIEVGRRGGGGGWHSTAGPRAGLGRGGAGAVWPRDAATRPHRPGTRPQHPPTHSLACAIHHSGHTAVPARLTRRPSPPPPLLLPLPSPPLPAVHRHLLRPRPLRPHHGDEAGGVPAAGGAAGSAARAARRPPQRLTPRSGGPPRPGPLLSPAPDACCKACAAD